MLSKKIAGLFSCQRTGWRPPEADSTSSRYPARGWPSTSGLIRSLLSEDFRPKTDRTELLRQSGGEYRARTGDLRLAKPALSQLS